MYHTIRSHTFEEIQQILDHVNSDDSPFDFRIRLRNFDFRSGVNRATSFNFLVDVPPTRRTIFYYTTLPSRSAKVCAAEVPMPWVTFEINAYLHPSKMDLEATTCIYSLNRFDSFYTLDAVTPWLGNHAYNTVCHGYDLMIDFKASLLEYFISVVGHYYSSTFNHSTAPYLSSPLMQHFALLSGSKTMFDALKTRSKQFKALHLDHRACSCHKLGQGSYLSAPEIHRVYQYLSTVTDFASVVPPFIRLPIVPWFVPSPTSYCDPTLFIAVYGIETIDEYIANAFDVQGTYRCYELEEVFAPQVSCHTPSLHRPATEQESSEVFSSSSTIELKEDDREKIDRFRDFYFYITGKPYVI